MRTATSIALLMSLSLPTAALPGPTAPGQPFDQQQQQYQQYQQYQQQIPQPQQYQQPPGMPGQQQIQQYQQPAGMPGQQQIQQYQPPQQVLPAGGGSQSGGPCTVKLSTDRSTIYLMDPSGTERKHVSLGQDRVQKVFNSPDGAWSVAIFKIRGAPQYGFVALELGKCEEQLPVDVPSVARAAAFDQGEVVLTFEGGEQRFTLKNQIIQ